MKNSNLFSLLSDDLIEEILVRVPVKSLHRCKCVCKGWRALISTPSFIYHITERSKSFPPIVTGIFGTDIVDREGFYPYNLTTGVNFNGFGSEMVADSQIDTSLSFLQRSVMPVASHKGILLCSEIPPRGGLDSLSECVQYILCDPFTRKWVSLPKPSINHYMRNVILFCYEKDQRTEFIVLGLVDSVSLFDKYCSETGEWNVSSILSKPPGFCISSVISHVLSDGLVYICAYSQHLCVYDLREEHTHFVDLPGAPYQAASRCLGVSSGLLYYAESNDICLRIWVLVGGVEWHLTHRAVYESMIYEFPETPYYLYPFHLLCFHPSSCNILLADPDNGWQQVLYHIDNRKTELIDKIDMISKFPVVPYSLPAWPPCIKIT